MRLGLYLEYRHRLALLQDVFFFAADCLDMDDGRVG
jgi:hypothetical protein